MLFGFAATVGYRYQLEHFFFELSVGPAATWTDIGNENPRLPRYAFSLSALGSDTGFIPDVGLAAGWRF